MSLVITQPLPPEAARCPRCKASEGLRRGRVLHSSSARYDVLSDSYGVMRCPHCGHKAAWIEFHRVENAQACHV